MKINTYSSCPTMNNRVYDRIAYNRGVSSSKRFNKIDESSMNLNSSRREASRYNTSGKCGKNLGNTVKYGNSLNSIKQILQGKSGYQNNLFLRKEKESSPEVKVDKVVNIKDDDYKRLYNCISSGVLSNRVKEHGVYENKRYIVLDKVRYESEIPKSQRLKNQKFNWNMR